MSTKTWPFLSPLAGRARDTDFDDRDEDDGAPPSSFCACDLQPMDSEHDSGRCASCGKALP